MAGDDLAIDVHSRDHDSELGLDEADLAVIENAQKDSNKVVTKPPVQPYRLGYISVFCIIINKMIGTGIFDTPTAIMHGTQSVGFTLIFWLLGSIATIAGALVFIEYGLSIPRWEFNGAKIFTPRSGGEFNYLTYLVKKPKFFASCVYGITFIIIGHASANSLSFASHVLSASGYTEVYDTSPPRYLGNWVRGIAIGTMILVCLMHGIWRRLGIAVNNVFALIKLLMLLLIILLGFMSIGGNVFKTPPPDSENLSPTNSFKNPQKEAYGYAEAYLAVIFAFGGFSQANYVLGEIRQPRKVFRSAVLFAVGTVCVSYMLVNIAYMIVVPVSTQVSGNVAEAFIRLTLGRVSTYGDRHAAEILHAFMAFSSLGNVIVSTYTAARVKQEIAKEGILPFSKLIARNYDALSRVSSCFRHRQSQKSRATKGWEGLYEKTPLGALLLHLFFTLLIIICTWGVSSPASAYTVVYGIYSYIVDAVTAVIIGSGLLCLRFLPNRTHWYLKSPSNGIISIASATLFVVANLFPLIALWVPPTTAFMTAYPWFLVPTLGVLLLVTGVLYWGIFVSIVPKLGSRRGKELTVERSPFFHTENGEPVQVAEVVAFDWTIRRSE
ncbi:amino acid/polyamine transporter I [Talaromyces proteolyticus]|uniref:Amino acid/polyamine transporter I n=1 Tax=Talaromyces proteolyticus TaxID=1131652 RepID=A0AAD4L389_9EURO|nr:amino acid/polyamine transporter I [Talaromyces proteolyticus]KAH8703794.1 amino acid/polyamine transporter I [Talaromyces proteolyticus]